MEDGSGSGSESGVLVAVGKPQMERLDEAAHSVAKLNYVHPEAVSHSILPSPYTALVSLTTVAQFAACECETRDLTSKITKSYFDCTLGAGVWLSNRLVCR